jgi:arylsulfatase A-like enzyme
MGVMRVDLRDSSAPGISAPIAGAGVAALVGLAEFARAALASGATPHELQRGVLLVLAVYPALGALAGFACWLARRIWAAPAAALALLATIAAIGADARPIVHIAGVALGLVTLRFGAWVLRQFPSAPRARLAASAALLALAAVAALAARALPAYGPRWALGAAVAALGAAVLVWTPRVRASALLLMGGAVYLLWQGAAHVQRLAPALKPAASAPSVLLVTIDALRADRLGAYGYAAARTPNFDALAAQGALFERAFTHSIVTGPSHATILSGRSPLSTQFVRDGQGLAPEIETLAEALARAGYVTAAFPSAAATLEASSRLPGRFQYADGDLREHRRFPAFVLRCVALRPLARTLTGPATWPSYRPASATTDLAVQFLEVHAAAPTFTWVHYFDPHLPYVPPAELRAAGAEKVSGDWYRLSAQQRAAVVADAARLGALRGLYDAEVAYVDRELGRLLSAASEHAPPGGLLIVVTSDHGEPMGEHGHHWLRDLYDATLRVPLLMVPPPRIVAAPRRVQELVRLMDVAPTIVDWLGLPKLAQAEGVSLAPLAEGAASRSPGPLIAVAEPEPDEFVARSIAVRRDDWKLIRRDDGLWASDRWSPGDFALFDLTSDPGEETNLAGARPDVLQELGLLLPPGRTPPAAPPLAPAGAEAQVELLDRDEARGFGGKP